MKDHPLRVKREARELSQVELSALADVSKQMISGIETGVKTPGMVTLRKLAFALKCKPEDICPDVVAKYRQQAEMLSA